MPYDAQYWIDRLGLLAHPEGGYYQVTFKSELNIAHSALPARFHGDRSASTAIYFLLHDREFSAFHRIAADEVWHFYAGSALIVYIIERDGKRSELHLGANLEAGETFQGVVRADCWFASRLKDEIGYALVGCTVAPGFDFADFELAERDRLTSLYPQHAELIGELTRLASASQ